MYETCGPTDGDGRLAVALARVKEVESLNASLASRCTQIRNSRDWYKSEVVRLTAELRFLKVPRSDHNTMGLGDMRYG